MILIKRFGYMVYATTKSKYATPTVNVFDGNGFE